MMNNFKANNSSPINKTQGQSYTITIGHERSRVVSVFIGTKSASEAICDAAIKKILYEHKDNW